MSEKKILLMSAAARGDEFGQRLRTALEEVGCDVEACDTEDVAGILERLGEGRLPVVLK